MSDSPRARKGRTGPKTSSQLSSCGPRWTTAEDALLRKAVDDLEQDGGIDDSCWSVLAERLYGLNVRTATQVRLRWENILSKGFRKGPWTSGEDEVLYQCVVAADLSTGPIDWAMISTRVPGRTAKQCRERWQNHLDPTLRAGPFTAEEDRILEKAVREVRLGVGASRHLFFAGVKLTAHCTS
jgi:hypothetical protein